MIGKMRSAAERFFHYGALALFLALMTMTIASDAFPQSQMLEQRLAVLTAGKRFSIVAWEVGAVTDKALGLIRGTPASAESSQFVRDFFAKGSEIQRLRDEAERLASQDPVPEDQLRAIEQKLGALYGERDRMENQAEDILAAQLTQALEAMALHTDILWWKPIFPPVTSEFVDLPLMLVVSPRDRIERRDTMLLVPQMSVSEMDALENAIYDLGYSALVTHIGGLSTYPAMIPEIYGLGFVLEAMPHEWTHDFLALHPLGWHYWDSGELTTMNETVCDIVGVEVGQQLARMFYPEYVREPTPEPTPSPAPHPAEPPSFDFGTEMRKTRLQVDALLGEGRLDEAEAYMEARRQEFVEHGYYIRKLNQAYFAFHGSYATGPGSVDPIGPQLQEFRAEVGSLRDFLLTMASMDSYDDLLRAIGEPVPAPTAVPATP